MTQSYSLPPLTPGSATMDLPNAAIGSRVIAYVLDILWVSGIPVLLLLVLSGAASGIANSGNYTAAMNLIGVMAIVPQLLGLALGVAYTVALGSGRTPGMKAVGLRLVSLDTGGAPGFWRALGRNIVFSLGGMVIVGYFSPLFDASGANRGWHDKASNTWMVDVKGETSAPSRPTRSESGLAPPPPPRVQTNVVLPPTPESSPYQAETSPEMETVLAPGRGAPAAQPATPPAPPAPASPPAVGLISMVPGFEAHPAPVAPVVAPAPAAPVPAPPVRPAAVLEAEAEAEDDDLDRTRAVAPVPATVRWILTLDTGDEINVDGSGFIGRNPVAPEGRTAQLIPVADDTKSLSKTHLGFGLDGARFWVTDRRSTNGTSLIRAGHEDRAVATDQPTFVEAGDVLALGDRRIAVTTQ